MCNGTRSIFPNRLDDNIRTWNHILMKNAGKIFEQDFINSMPGSASCLRFNDAGGWGQSTKTRFTTKSICDFVVYYNRTLYLLELKSHKGKSLPLSCIKDHQIKGLATHMIKPHVHAGLIINFRDLNETYFLNIQHVVDLINTTTIKSISIALCRQKGVLIRQRIKKVRYTYSVDDLFNIAEEEG